MVDKKQAERFAQAVAAQVRAEIAAASSSVAAIARATKINRETLDRWVKGERALSIPNLYLIAHSLKLDPHLIVLRAEERFDAERPANVVSLREAQIITEDEALELGAVAKSDVIEVEDEDV